MVRHFSTILGDFTDTLLHWDARLPRTLWPLLVRPGFLTRAYFAGRRVRYVSTVRLFVPLAIVTFSVPQLMLRFGGSVTFGSGLTASALSFPHVPTVEEIPRPRPCHAPCGRCWCGRASPPANTSPAAAGATSARCGCS